MRSLKTIDSNQSTSVFSQKLIFTFTIIQRTIQPKRQLFYIDTPNAPREVNHPKTRSNTLLRRSTNKNKTSVNISRIQSKRYLTTDPLNSTYDAENTNVNLRCLFIQELIPILDGIEKSPLVSPKKEVYNEYLDTLSQPRKLNPVNFTLLNIQRKVSVNSIKEENQI